jgi:hypothetical protein
VKKVVIILLLFLSCSEKNQFSKTFNSEQISIYNLIIDTVLTHYSLNPEGLVGNEKIFKRRQILLVDESGFLVTLKKENYM